MNPFLKTYESLSLKLYIFLKCTYILCSYYREMMLIQRLINYFLILFFIRDTQFKQLSIYITNNDNILNSFTMKFL